MLLALPNGQWVDHSIVVGARPTSTAGGWRVMVDVTTSLTMLSVAFDSEDDARDWAYDFAQKCNDASRLERSSLR